MNSKTKKARIDKAVQSQARSSRAISQQIHAWAERPFRETNSADRLPEYLEANGFRIEFPFRNIPTAFRATWGSGKPAVGLLGEYDALPNCGADDGTWGHG